MIGSPHLTVAHDPELDRCIKQTEPGQAGWAGWHQTKFAPTVSISRRRSARPYCMTCKAVAPNFEPSPVNKARSSRRSAPPVDFLRGSSSA